MKAPILEIWIRKIVKIIFVSVYLTTRKMVLVIYILQNKWHVRANANTVIFAITFLNSKKLFK